MEKIPQKAILSYAQLSPYSHKDWEFKIDNYDEDEYALIVVVDCEKMDKNSGKFDQNYYDSLTKKYQSMSNIMRFVSGRFGVINNIIDDINSFFGVKLKPWFKYKNYNYIDSIEEKIQLAIKESSHPYVMATFRATGESPILQLGFYNFNSARTEIKDYLEELHTILNNEIDLKQYNISYSVGSPNT